MCDKSQCQIWKLSEICLNSRLTYLIDNSSTLFFSMIMALWTVLFIDFWERKQARLQFEWGTFDFEKELEADRIDFERNVKKYKKNPITGVSFGRPTIFIIKIFYIKLNFKGKRTACSP
jgi:anoctamin-5